MFKLPRTGLPVCLLVSLSTPALAAPQDPFFQGLGDLPEGVSFSYATAIAPDGEAVVGVSGGADGTQAFFWNSDGMIGLGDLPGGAYYSHALGVSAYDRVCGFASVSEGQVAFSWHESTVLLQVAYYYPSRMTDLSADGLLGVGYGLLWGVDRALWYEPTFASPQPLGDPSAEPDRAHGCSAFSNLAVGSVDLASGTRACQWPDPGVTGIREVLDDTGFDSSVATNCSTDGRVVVGYGSRSGAQVAALWFDGSPHAISDPSGNLYPRRANGVSGRGERIVGTDANSVPWILEMGVSSEPKRLREVMETTYGLDLTGWVLIDAADISGDGQYITGSGYNQGNPEAWIACLPIGCRADLNGDGDVNLLDVTLFANDFIGPRTAISDFNGDGLIQPLDISEFSAAHNAGCAHQSSGGSGGSGGGGLWPHVPAGDPDDVGGGET